MDGVPLGFRHRARLAVRGKRPLIGIFEPNSHRVVDIPDCAIHHPLINRVAAALKAAMMDTGTTSYDEQSRRGLVRYLQVVVERASQTAQVVLVINSEQLAPARTLCRALVSRLGHELHSLFVNLHVARSNAILGSKFYRVFGVDMVRETFGTAVAFFPPGAFGQSNLELFDRILRQLVERCPSHVRVVEYYAGVGALGLGLLETAERVIFNEVNAHSIAGLKRGLSQRSVAERARSEIVEGHAGEHARLVDSADVVICDPPRKGLDPELLTELAHTDRPLKLFYISCGFESWLRDTEALVRGGLQLERVVPYALFPYTDHVELFCEYVRS